MNLRLLDIAWHSSTDILAVGFDADTSEGVIFGPDAPQQWAYFPNYLNAFDPPLNELRAIYPSTPVTFFIGGINSLLSCDYNEESCTQTLDSGVIDKTVINDISGQPGTLAHTWAVGYHTGDSETRVLQWNGSDAWTDVSGGVTSDGEYRGVSVDVNNGIGFVVGIDFNPNACLIRRWDGLSFMDDYDIPGSAQDKMLNSVWVDPGTDTAWAVGEMGTILYYNLASADEWVEVPSPTTENLNKVHGFVDNIGVKHIYIVGDNGTILEYLPGP